MSNRLSILVVSSTPHRRKSTAELELLLAEMARHPEIDAWLWFLRGGHKGDLESFTKVDHRPFVVDSLRTWPPAALARAIGLEPVAGALRGWRLRRLLRKVRPDAVILDDGFGERILGRAEATTLRIVRSNDDEPMTAAMEEPFAGRPDGVIIGPRADPPAGVPSIVVSPMLEVWDYTVPRALAGPAAQAEMRAELGIEPDQLVVVGWGTGGWIEGADLFIRGLWALRDRHGLDALGLWIGHDVNEQDQDRLRAEAKRCGLADRYLLVHRPPSYQLCGDLVFLPYRCYGERSVLDAVASGLPVVAFRALAIVDDGVELVPDLDIDAAAAALAGHRPDRRAERLASARRMDVAAVIDDLVQLVRAGRQ